MLDTSSTSPLTESEDARGTRREHAASRREVFSIWLAGQPLVPPAIGLMLGIALDAVWHWPWFVVYGLFVAAGCLVMQRRSGMMLRHAGLLLAAMAVGATLHDLAFRHWPDDHVVRYVGADSTAARLTGEIVAEPVVRRRWTGRIRWYRESPRTRMLVSAEKIAGVDGDIPVSGVVAVHVREPVLHVHPGDRVELFGRLYRPRGPQNPGEHDWSLTARRRGILVEMSCEHAANVVHLPGGDRPRKWLASMRRRARAALLDHTSPGGEPGSRVLSAMVLGQRSAVEPELNESFARAGVVHYLAVSGAHVGMLMSAIWGLGLLTGPSRRTCAWAAIVAVTAYAVLAEPRPPILRAAIMADLACLAILLRRPLRSANWLAFAAIVLLVIDPMQLFDAGFQLSFITVAALILLLPRLHAAGRQGWLCLTRRTDPLLQPEIQDRLHPRTGLRRASGRVTRILGWWLALTVTAWMVSLPLSAFHFQRVSLPGWFSNLVVFPLVWLVELVGLGKTLLTSIWPASAGPTGPVLHSLTDALLAMVRWFAGLPGAGMTVPAPSGWWVAGWLGLLGFWAVRPWLRVPKRYVIISLVLFGTVSVYHFAPRTASDELRLHLLAVGDGTACLIELPDGRTLVYDIGSRPPYDIDRHTLGPLLSSRRVYRLGAVILSHPNLDHYSGLPELLDRRRLREVITTPYFELAGATKRGPRRVMLDAQSHEVSWKVVTRADRTIDTGDVVTEILWPPPLDELQIEEINDTSMVLRLIYAGRSILLCGDIDEVAERGLMATGDLRADVLVLPHHGSVVKTTEAFIDTVDPTWCLRSSGRRDTHTTNGLLELMAGRKYWNTADHGAIEVRISTSGLQVLRPRHPD